MNIFSQLRISALSLIAATATFSSFARAEPVPTADFTAPIKVACVGDSITAGSGVRNPENKYPATLGRFLGDKWQVKNFGVSATTLLHRGDRPYIKQKAYTDALEFKPDVLIVKLGTNDSKHPSPEFPTAVNNWQYKADFAGDYKDLLAAFRAANAKVRVYACLTVPAYPGNWGINDITMREEIAPIVRDVARETGATVIDLYGALRSKPQLFPDKVHPNDEGAGLIAAEVYRMLTGKIAPGTTDVNEQMPAFRAQESVLFQGDSITDGNRGRNADPNHILGHGYAFIIAAQNGARFAQRQLTFANRGVSGNKVSNLAARWTNDTLNLKPTLLSILIGVNDAGAGVPLAQFEADYDKLLADTVAALPGVRLVLCEPFSLPVGGKKDNWDVWFADIKARQAVVERLGTKYNAPVVHFQAAFDEVTKRAPASYWIWDGVHPTYAGHQLMADEWTRTVNQMWPVTAPVAAMVATPVLSAK